MLTKIQGGNLIIGLRSRFVLFSLLFLIHTSVFAQTDTRKFLALGDSYTIGESVSIEGRWPMQLVAELKKKGHHFDTPQIIATTGWRTDDLKNAILKANPAKDFDLVSLLIGVNNQYQGRSAAQYAIEFEELLKMAISFAAGDHKRVIVLSIPDYGYTPYGRETQPKISKEIDEFNDINRRISTKYGVSYYYITDISRRGIQDSSLIAEDGLHPSAEMYSEWVKLIMKDF